MATFPKIGIPHLDKDHREILIYLLQMDPEREDLDYSVISSYLREHLFKEEEYMRSIGFSGLQAHVDEHTRLSKEFTELVMSPAMLDKDVRLKAINDIIADLVHHISTFDAMIPVPEGH